MTEEKKEPEKEKENFDNVEIKEDKKEPVSISEEFGIKQELIDSPYFNIMNYAENIYKYMGGIVFQYASLIPVSLIAPPMVFEGKKIKIGVNVMLLAISGAGKSSMCNILKNITINPIDRLSFTTAGAENRFEEESGTIIIQDLARITKDIHILKTIENSIGEEEGGEIENARRIKKIKKNVALVCGVPNDICESITSGLISRCSTLLIFHSDEQMDKIAENIADKVGKSFTKTRINEQDIKEYYNLLKRVQKGEIEKYKPIDSYHIPEEYRKIIVDSWKNTKREIIQSLKERIEKIIQKLEKEGKQIPKSLKEGIPTSYFNRELFDCFRFMFLLAFLNYFNREKKNFDVLDKDGKVVGQEYCIIPNDNDLRFAIRLMIEEIKTKFDVLRSEKFAMINGGNKELQNNVFENQNINLRMKKLVEIYIDKYKKKR